MNLRRHNPTPFRLLAILAIIILLATQPASAQQRGDPSGGDDGGQTVSASASANGLSLTATASTNGGGQGQQIPTASTQPVAGGPGIWTVGATICVDAAYGCPWHWNHANGSDGLPRQPMKLVGDHYEAYLARIPAEDFTFGFVDRNQSDGARESRWLPGNVAGFKQGNPWVIPHKDNPGADFLMRANGSQMRLATPDEVAAFRRAKVAGK